MEGISKQQVEVTMAVRIRVTVHSKDRVGLWRT